MKKISRIMASVMLVAAIAFVAYALNHPDMSFPWNNTVTYIIYGIYAFITLLLFIAPFKNSNSK